MQLPTIINLILLLSFTYFITSLLVTSINEVIAGSLRLRQKQLQMGITRLFFEKDWKDYIEKHFLKSPYIESLMKRGERYPAYIPAKNFAMAVLTHCSIDRNKLNAADVNNAIQASTCLPQKMKDLVKGYIMQGEANLEELEKDLEEFYNNAMDRVSGWYKRKIRRITLIVGLGLATALNIDTVKIVAEGLGDKEHLAKTADAIAQQVASINKDGSMRVITNGDTVKVTTQTKTALGIDSTTELSGAVAAIKNEQVHTRDIIMVYKNTTGLSMGYADRAAIRSEWMGGPDGFNIWVFLKKILGLLLTAFALQLGSNYWFGVLNKVISIRAAGAKPDENKTDK